MIVSLLLDKGVDVNAKSKSGIKAYDAAKKLNNEPIMNMLKPLTHGKSVTLVFFFSSFSFPFSFLLFSFFLFLLFFFFFSCFLFSSQLADLLNNTLEFMPQDLKQTVMKADAKPGFTIRSSIQVRKNGFFSFFFFFSFKIRSDVRLLSSPHRQHPFV